jgi:hypothetical protein
MISLLSYSPTTTWEVAMSGYELLLFLHVVCVIVWLGAGTTLALIAVAAERMRDRPLQDRLGALGRWLGPRVFLPATLGALAFGLALVAKGSWTFGPLWIKLGLGAFAVSLLLNATVRFPLLRRLEGAEGAETDRAGRLLALLGRVELTVLYLAVADMIAKPSGSDTAALAAGGAILALAVVAGVVGGAQNRVIP